MPLGLEAQALPNLLKSGFHLPAPHEPTDDPFGSCIEIGAQQSLGLELFFRISDQNPTQGHGGQARAVPNRPRRNHLHNALLCAVPVSHRDGPPGGGGVLGYDRKVGQTLALEARSSYLVRLPRRGRSVEGSVQPEAGDEGDRIGEPPAAIEELEGSIATVCDGYDCALRVPAPDQQEHLPGPFGYLLMSLASLFGVAFGWSQRAEDGQRPNSSCPRDLCQQRKANPSEGIGLDKVRVTGTHGVTVDPLRRDLLSLPPLQRLIYAQDERTLRDESFY